MPYASFADIKRNAPNLWRQIVKNAFDSEGELDEAEIDQAAARTHLIHRRLDPVPGAPGLFVLATMGCGVGAVREEIVCAANLSVASLPRGSGANNAADAHILTRTKPGPVCVVTHTHSEGEGRFLFIHEA